MSKQPHIKFMVAFTDGTCKRYARPTETPFEADDATFLPEILAFVHSRPYVRVPMGIVWAGREYTLAELETPAKPKASRKAAKADPKPVVAPAKPKRTNAHEALMHGRSKAAQAYKASYTASRNLGHGHVLSMMRAHNDALAA